VVVAKNATSESEGIMREIKFRAWDKEEKRMVGNVERAYDGMSEDCKNGEYYGFISCFDDFLLEEQFEVMQYTGLKDKNGKEIYEGDIVKFEDWFSDAKFTALIEFGNPNGTYTWGWQLHHISGNKPNMDILLWIDMDGAGAEVIGNIYENPELVESEE
jgi:uncharacterized phage protein (TIGR01671 family)